MSSTLLIVIGVAGLLACGVVRVAPALKGLVKLRPTRNELHSVVAAYSVIHSALVANGESDQADHLRTKILPAAVTPSSES